MSHPVVQSPLSQFIVNCYNVGVSCLFTHVSNNRMHLIPLGTVRYFTEVYIIYRLTSDVCQFICNHASYDHACIQLAIVCTDAWCVSLLDIQYVCMNNGMYTVHTMLCELCGV